MFKTQWDLLLFRGKNDNGMRLAHLILNDPVETGSVGDCNSQSNYAGTDKRWFEAGVRGKQHAAKDACAALKSMR